jgi:sterol desaturase/sphingolipid hydroxylase (fatty acid hydroxylase superfamily)
MPHFVSNKDESVRMFKSDFLDYFSRVDFRVPLFLFVPAILFFLALSVVTVPPLAIPPLVALGVVLWTFTEYNLHRFVFHWIPRGKIGRQLHFMFHGVHHDYPRDSKRLVMVPAVTVPMAIVFYLIFHWLFRTVAGNADLAYPCSAGFGIGYLFYDMTHYALHHATFKSRFWLDLKQHHMAHHYQDSHRGFGVSTRFWDLLFRTAFGRKAEEVENSGS